MNKQYFDLVHLNVYKGNKTKITRKIMTIYTRTLRKTIGTEECY